MMTRSKTNRRGLTLTEALVALFVASIGMIALITLFPLGALQMAQAVKDQRCTDAAVKFDAAFRANWRQNVLFTSPFLGPVDRTTIYTNLGAFAGPSRPIFVDPLGRAVSAGAAVLNPLSVAPPVLALTVPNDNFIPRVGLSSLGLTGTAGYANRVAFSSLLDDISYDESGLPVATGGVLERGARYNAAAVLQQLVATDPRVDFKILVFEGRAANYMPATNEQAFTIASNTVANYVGAAVNLSPYSPIEAQETAAGSSLHTTTLVITYAGEPPPITKGRWVMLRSSGWSAFTVTRAGLPAPVAIPAKAPVISFNRVVSVDAETPNQMTVELERPIGDIHRVVAPVLQGTDTTAPVNGYVVTVRHELVAIAGLAEVYERPPLPTN